AKSPHVGGRKHNEETTQQRWEQAKGPGTDPEQSGLQAGQERDDRWEIDVPECGMVAAVEVVELVGMETQGAVGREVESDDRGCGAAKEKAGGPPGMLLDGHDLKTSSSR